MSKKIEFGAEMTFKQFIALTKYLQDFDVIEQVTNTEYFHRLKIANNIDKNDIKKWVFNGWNTERILQTNKDLLDIKDNYFALQWSFPQAYYSVFMLTLSFMHLNGQNTTSHSGVIQKFGEFAESNKYPKMISFYSKGTIKNPEYFNISKFPSATSFEFDSKSLKSCQTQICQFLNGTRKILLEEKRKDKNISKIFTTGKGKKTKLKIKLNEDDWNVISNKIGVTNILHLLYRKRIKSNYREIDSFTYENLKADFIHQSLIEIVNKLNFIHECYIYKMIGSDTFLSFYLEYSKKNSLPFLEKRIELINNNL